MRVVRAMMIATLVVLLAGAAGFFGLRFWLGAALERNLTPDGPITVEVEAGASIVDAMAQVYAAAGVEFGQREKGLLWIVEYGDCLQRGTHTIPAGATYRRVLEALCEPTSRSAVRVTIREGLNQWEVAEAVAEAGVSTRNEVLAAIAETQAPVAGATTMAEGYLFPDTYEFYADAAAATVVERLVARSVVQLERAFSEAGVAYDPSSESPVMHGLTAHELVILASMVEAEAAVADERPLIARVFVNRLAQGMRLQSDPTCMYGEALYGRPATRADCRNPESRYSTYVINGLPPGPIGNPGLASIQAVLAPADDPDVLYFVAYGDGSRRHRFADTYDEHRANVALYREALAE